MLSLSWNGLHSPGVNALAKALGKNTTLEELDIASNRIDDELLVTLANGLKKNSTLKTLKVNSYKTEILYDTLYGKVVSVAYAEN